MPLTQLEKKLILEALHEYSDRVRSWEKAEWLVDELSAVIDKVESIPVSRKE